MKIVNYKKISRDLAIADGGYFDSRFTTKVVKDKKKEASKRACKEKVEY